MIHSTLYFHRMSAEVDAIVMIVAGTRSRFWHCHRNILCLAVPGVLEKSPKLPCGCGGEIPDFRMITSKVLQHAKHLDRAKSLATRCISTNTAHFYQLQWQIGTISSSAVCTQTSLPCNLQIWFHSELHPERQNWACATCEADVAFQSKVWKRLGRWLELRKYSVHPD